MLFNMWVRNFSLICFFLFASCNAQTSSEQLFDLQLQWQLVENNDKDGTTRHTATFFITNKGEVPLADTGWTIYWNQAPHLVITSKGDVTVGNINGDFYRMFPNKGFSLMPGETITVSYISDGWIIKESDAPMGMYVEIKNNNDLITIPMKKFEVLPFVNPAQYTRSAEDKEPFPDAAYLYSQNERLLSCSSNSVYPFIPAPSSWIWGNGSFKLPDQIVISCAKNLLPEALYLSEELKQRYGLQVEVKGEELINSHIQLSSILTEGNKEGYSLTVNADKGIEIKGNSNSGVFYGIQSFLSLTTSQKENKPEVAAIVIEDRPAFPYRGLHIDVGRNFQSKETILRMLDLMARYKLNRLLLYLTEDEGWRLEINGLPELTEVGARRGHQYRDSLYLQPAYGSGPNSDDENSTGNGYYSREDFKEIIRYAHDRHIAVIPEVNLPGHARAAIKAMELRYNRLIKAGKFEEANIYRLIDPDDTSFYISAQGYFDNTACVCQDQIVTFFETVVDDIILMYKEAEVPLHMIHTGGDEVPSTAWIDSPICKEFLKQHPEITDTRNLQGLFFAKLVQLLKKRGLQTGAWEEAVMVFGANGTWSPSLDPALKGVYTYVWNNLWGNQDLGYKLANQGYPTILCNVTNFYFDLAYDKDPREPGLYWAGFVDTQDAFSFEPYSIFQSTNTDDMGRVFDKQIDFKDMVRLTSSGKENIIGLQAQLWSETIKGRAMLEYYSLPKLIGFGQRAWQGQPAWGTNSQEKRLADWSCFLNTVVQVELPFLDHFNGGYNYRIPAPGISVQNGSVRMNSGYPSSQIRYTLDGSEPTSKSTLYETEFSTKAKNIKAACFNVNGRSGLSTTLNLNE